MNDLGHELGDALQSCLRLLQPRDTSSSSTGASSSTGRESNVYDMRRAIRRLSRVVDSLEGWLCENRVVDDNMQYISNNLVSILTQLGQAVVVATESFSVLEASADLWMLYYKISMEASRILLHILLQEHTNNSHQACLPVVLEPAQVDALLDRVGTLLCWYHQSMQQHQGGGIPPKETLLLLGAVVTLINTHLAMMEAQGRALELLLKPCETVQLLQLAIPQCMQHLLIRWDVEHCQQQDQQQHQEARLQLCVFVTHLFQHLVNLREQDTQNGPQEETTNTQRWLQGVLYQPAQQDSPTTDTSHQDAQQLLAAIHDFGVEVTEYALDVLDGASLVLNSETNQHCVAVLRDAIRHVSLATTVISVLEQIGSVEQISTRSLLVTYSTFAASTCHEALLQLVQDQQEEEDLDAIRNTASELLLQLTRVVLQQTASTSFIEDPAMENAIAIAVLKGLEVPAASQDTDCILEFITESCGAASQQEQSRPSKRQRSNTTAPVTPQQTQDIVGGVIPSRNKNTLHVLEAAAMSALVLPNQGDSSSNGGKQHQLNRLLEAIAGHTSSQRSPDPWQTLLSKKIEEEGMLSQNQSLG